MVTKKSASGGSVKSRRKTARAVSAVSAMATGQVTQLRKTIEQLRSRLVEEAKKRTRDVDVLNNAKKARDALAKQMSALKQQGQRLSKDLKKALGDADRREIARQQALKKIGELRAQLAHKTDELRRKTEELAKVARESASRAKDIIMSEPPAAPPPLGAEPSSEPPAAGATHTEPAESEAKGKTADPEAKDDLP